MAVVSRIATLKFSATVGGDTAGFRQWVATAATQDTAAGSSVAVTLVHSAGGAAPPEVPDSVAQLKYINDSGTIIRTVNIPFSTGTTNDTFFFTDTGLTGGSARCGTVEILIDVTRTAVGTSYDYETDGTPATAPTGFTAVTVDRGWIRGTTTLVEDISNTSLGGAPNPPAAYITGGGDSLFVRTTSGAASYVAQALTVALTHGSVSGATNSTTSATRDVTFSGVVDNRFPVASTVVGLSVTVPNATLTGQPAWTYTSTTDDTIVVDPRFFSNIPSTDPAGGVLFHRQATGAFFLDPPTSGDDPTGQRVFPDVGYLSVRYTNARGEGVNGLTVTLKVWDADNVTGTESSPTHSSTGKVTRLTPDPPPTPTSPQGGWLPLAATGTDENTLPVTWSTVAAGTWRVKSVVTAPSDATGLEAYTLVSGGDSWNRNIFFITTNPNLGPVISIHPENISHHGTHLTPDDELIPVVYLFDLSTHSLVSLVDANGDNVSIHIVREHHPTMRMDYFNFDTEEWVGKANFDPLPEEALLTLIRGDEHASSLGTGDPDIWTTASHLGGEIFAPDGAAGELDTMIIADIVYNGVHYPAFAPVILVASGNHHNKYALDAVGLALSGKLGFK